jgi:hypothetical protein
MVRDVATWLPGGAKPRNPFDQLLDPFGAKAHENRIDGRELLRSHGVVGKRDHWGNFSTGLVLEMAMDPLTYMGAGVLGKGAAALSKAGFLSNKADLLKEMAETSKAGKPGKVSNYIGGRGSGKMATGNQLFDHWKATREKIIKDSTENKVAGSRLSGKNTYNSLDELNELNHETLKDGAWAVVDKDDEYQVFQWKADEPGAKGEWNKLDKVGIDIMGKLRTTATPHTLDTVRNVYKSQFEKMYPDSNFSEALSKPLESLVSFRLPFAKEPFYEVNVPNPGAAFDNWVGKQPDAPQHNAGQAPPPPPPATPTPQPATPSPSPGPASQATQQTPPKTYASFAEEVEDNADDWGLRNQDGSIRTSQVGPEATRVLHEAAKVFGKQAVETWDVIETAAAGAAKLKGIAPDDFFKNLSIDIGTIDDMELIKKGGALSQKSKEMIKGGFFMDDVKMTIKAFKDGDISTLHHEFAHALRRQLDDKTLAGVEKAISTRMKKLGLKGPLKDKDGVWSVEAEEVFARSWERYLKEGKAPTESLESAFAKLKDWLTEIYKKLVQHNGLSRTLDADTRKIFDKLIMEGDSSLRSAAPAAPAAKSAKAPKTAKSSSKLPKAASVAAATVPPAVAATTEVIPPAAADVASDMPPISNLMDAVNILKADNTEETAAALLAKLPDGDLKDEVVEYLRVKPPKKSEPEVEQPWGALLILHLVGGCLTKSSTTKCRQMRLATSIRFSDLKACLAKLQTLSCWIASLTQ